MISFNKSKFLFCCLILCLKKFKFNVQAETLPPLEENGVPRTFEELWEGFDPTKEPLDVELLHEWEENGVVLKVIRYRIGIYNGVKSMMAGIYGYPKGATNLPGLVQLHGGGQAANSRAPLTNAKRGYATLSVAWAGQITAPNYRVGPAEVKLFWDGETNHPNYRVTTDWGALDAYFSPSKYPETLSFLNTRPFNWTLDSVPSPRNNPWFLVAMGARRAVTFLQKQREVNADLIGMYGFSMGGKHTVDTVSIDKRVKAAAPAAGGISDRIKGDALYKSTISDPNPLKRITCPILLLVPSNDFHAIIDNIPQAIDEMPTETWRVSSSVHYNHHDSVEHGVATTLWMDQHLKGSFTFPKSPELFVNISHSGAFPRASVSIDSSLPVVDVSVYYTQQGRLNSKTVNIPHIVNRYWRHAPVEEEATDTWVADIPLFTTSSPLWVFATVTYALGKTVSYAGHYYQVKQSNKLSLTSVPQIFSPGDLQAVGITAHLSPTLLIEDFKDDWEKNWYKYSEDPSIWGRSTHKVYDPQWRAPFGASLSFQVLASEPSKMVVVLDNYAAEVFVNGTNGTTFETVEVFPSDFRDAIGGTLNSFFGFRELTLSPEEKLYPQSGGTITLGGWNGPDPTFRNLKWKVGNSNGTWETGYDTSVNTLGLWHFDHEEEGTAWNYVGENTLAINLVPDGKFGYALENTAINVPVGSNDFVLSVEPNPYVSSDFFPSGNDPSLTVETWAKFNDIGAPYENQLILDHWGETGGWRLYLLKGTEWLVGLLGNPRHAISVQANLTDAVINNGEWHHYAMTWDGPMNTARLYIDGNEHGTRKDDYFDEVGYPGHDRVSFLGAGLWPLTGIIDEVRISSGALDFEPSQSSPF